MKTNIYLFIIALMIGATSCNNGSSSGDLNTSVDSLMNESANANNAKLSEEVIDQIIETFPSPLELTSILSTSGAEFNSDYLNSSDNMDRFESSAQKAFNLGVYGADLGYTNFFEKPTQALGILSAVRDLSNDLKVGQFFDFGTMKRLAENKNNLDSLMYISTRGFQEMDDYLTSNGRGEISLLMLYGGWLEGLYLASESCRNTPEVSQELIDQIGEQKIVVDNLLLLIEAYKNSPSITPISQDLESLKSIYDKVTISFTYAEPTRKVVNGMLVLEDNSRSEIKVEPAVLVEIMKTVSLIRNKKVMLS